MIILNLKAIILTASILSFNSYAKITNSFFKTLAEGEEKTSLINLLLTYQSKPWLGISDFDTLGDYFFKTKEASITCKTYTGELPITTLKFLSLHPELKKLNIIGCQDLEVENEIVILPNLISLSVSASPKFDFTLFSGKKINSLELDVFAINQVDLGKKILSFAPKSISLRLQDTLTDINFIKNLNKLSFQQFKINFNTSDDQFFATEDILNIYLKEIATEVMDITANLKAEVELKNFSPSLKTFKLKHLYPQTQYAVKLSGLAKLNNLEELEVHYPVKNMDLAQTNLTKLTYKNSCDQKECLEISLLPTDSLKELTIENAVLKAPTMFEKLEVLNIEGDKMPINSWANHQYPNLKEYQDNSKAIESIDFKNFPGLKSFSSYSSSFKDVKNTQYATSLEKFVVNDTRLKSQSLWKLKNFKNLKVLGIGRLGESGEQSNGGSAGVDLAFLLELDQLESLELYNDDRTHRVNASAIQYFKNLQNLKRLDLDANFITADDLALFPVMGSLEHLRVWNNKIDESIMSVDLASHFPSLKSLYITENLFDETVLTELQKKYPNITIF